MGVTPSQFELLSKMLSVTALQHRVIAHNVANVNTPTFHRLDVDFEQALAKQLARGKAADFEKVQPRVVEDPRGPFRVDGNNVDINAEMSRLTKNAVLHNASVQILASKTDTMRRAIMGNRG
jgi:flagellar basal-body rod protein FlgB